MDQAMLRLLATPKTTAVRPSRLDVMRAPESSEWKGYSRREATTQDLSRCFETGQPRAAVPTRVVTVQSFDWCDVSCCRDARYGPDCADECHSIYQPDDGKSGDKIVLRDCADQESHHYLQRGPGKIKRVLHASHKMFWHHFHDAGVHCHPC